MEYLSGFMGLLPLNKQQFLSIILCANVCKYIHSLLMKQWQSEAHFSEENYRLLKTHNELVFMDGIHRLHPAPDTKQTLTAGFH